jgi:hypothetical protein
MRICNDSGIHIQYYKNVSKQWLLFDLKKKKKPGRHLTNLIFFLYHSKFTQNTTYIHEALHPVEDRKYD